MEVPLWQQLQATATVIVAVRAGVSGSVAISRVAPALRAGVQALAFQVWRNLGRAEALRRHLVRRPPPAASDALLCVALALAWRGADASYDSFTLVNQTVEAAKRQPASRAQAGFLNACLRRFVRERAALLAATDSDPVAVWNHPAWWIAQVQHDQPQHWQAILTAANTPAPLTLRVNARKTSVPAYQALLADAGCTAWATPTGALVLERAVAVERLPGFAQGLVSVQDAAAQMAAPLLLADLPPGKPLRILDACAAPGGKTGHLLERSDATVTALELDPVRAARITDNLQRLGLQATVLIGDAARPQDWWDGQGFDGILLDAPCTASGIVRRHPDVRWLRRPSDVSDLAQVQADMLQALWPLLRPGGRLLYSTCSVFLAEGDKHLPAFLARNPDAVCLPAPGHILPCTAARPEAISDNSRYDHDGFYYALLQKRMA